MAKNPATEFKDDPFTVLGLHLHARLTDFGRQKYFLELDESEHQTAAAVRKWVIFGPRIF
jgi:hypothetical protein